MGDKSPKSARKQAQQKLTKVDADKRKKEAVQEATGVPDPKANKSK